MGLQALVLLGLGVLFAVLGFTGSPHDRLASEVIAVLAVLTAVGLGYVARGLHQAARWSRAPAIVWEIIMLPVGVSLAQAIPPLGAALLGTAALSLAAVFAMRPVED